MCFLNYFVIVLLTCFRLGTVFGINRVKKGFYLLGSIGLTISRSSRPSIFSKTAQPALIALVTRTKICANRIAEKGCQAMGKYRVFQSPYGEFVVDSAEESEGFVASFDGKNWVAGLIFYPFAL